MIEPNVYHGLPRRIGTYWGGFAGEAAQAADWHSMVDATTERFRGYLSARLDETADVPQEVGDRLREWIQQDANLWALSQWLDTGKGWETEGLGAEVEKAFAAAVNGSRRRFWLARLEAAAQRNRNAAALLKDPAGLDNVLARLADPRKPLCRVPGPYKLLGTTEGPELAMFMAFPGLKEGDEVPDFCRVRPTVPWRGPYPDPLPPNWIVSPALALQTLKGVLGWNDWWLLQAFISDEPGERWLRLLAWAWLDERLARALEAHNARPLRPRTIKHGGHEWAKLPKVLGGVSWALGGQATTVELDGHQYAPAPGMKTPGRLERTVAKVPLGYTLLPADAANKPHQAVLPIDLGEEAPPLAVAVAGSGALGEAAGKLGVYILAASVGHGLQKVTLRELTKAINPGARVVKSHFETVAAALVELHNLRLFMPNGLAHNVFYLPTTPWKELSPEAYDVSILASMDPGLISLLASNDGNLKAYRGDFLVDLTGAMELPTKQPGLLRQYLRAAATWNAYFDPTTKAPDPSRMPAIPMDRWATLTNALPLAAVDYLAADRKQSRGRNRMAEAITRILGELEDLAARGLVAVDRANRKEVRLLPTERHLEAWRKAQRKSKG